MTIHQQKGVALLSAMVTVSIVAALASGAMWLRWQRVEVEIAARGQAQTAWLLSGAFAWSRLILSEDGKANRQAPVDHLGEPWAIEVEESKISSFLSQDKQLLEGDADVFIAGRIRDEQAKLNVRNLVAGGTVDIPFLRVLQRLCADLNIDSGVLQPLVVAMVSMDDATQSERSLLPGDERHLAWLGLSEAALNKLSPFVTWLPTPTRVNVNTAPVEVLMALLPTLGRAQATSLLLARERNHWANIAQFRETVGSSAYRLSDSLVSVSTDYFKVRGSIQYEGTSQVEEALMHRNVSDVRIVWRRQAQGL